MCPVDNRFAPGVRQQKWPLLEKCFPEARLGFFASSSTWPTSQVKRFAPKYCTNTAMMPSMKASMVFLPSFSMAPAKPMLELQIAASKASAFAASHSALWARPLETQCSQLKRPSEHVTTWSGPQLAPSTCNSRALHRQPDAFRNF